MNPFGPFYPPLLQQVVNHAERLVDLLSADELLPTERNEWAQAWVTGRGEEITRFVEHIASAWRGGELDAPAAARALQRYLDVLHEGLRDQVGWSGTPRCCTQPGEHTSVPARLDAQTCELSLSAVASLLEPADSTAEAADATQQATITGDLGDPEI